MMSIAAAVLLIWVEGESFNYASEQVKPTRADYATASGGAILYGPGVASKGSVVRWSFTLPQAIPQGKIIFRYCRLHWRESMVPASYEIKLTSGDWSRTLTTAFDNTGGWGKDPANWGLATLAVGDLPAGEIAMQMTSLAEINDINLDGFFVAGADVAITAEELNSMARLDIDSDGYIGLALDSTTISQGETTTLPVAARRFGAGPLPQVAVSLDSVEKAGVGVLRPLQPAGTRADERFDRTLIDYALGEQPDGPRVLTITTDQPPRRVTTDLLLIGTFTATLDKRIEAVETFVNDYDKAVAANRAAVVAQADFTEAVAFLTHGRDVLAGSIAETESAWRTHLATQEGVADAAPLAANLAKTLDQCEATIAAIKAGKAPYDGRTGELRRAYYSASTGELRVYRCLIPKAYAAADSVPLILMLHGGGGNENTYHDMDDGRVLEILDKQGYVMLAPKYHSRNQPAALEDLAELVDLTLRAYPKIDRRRIYCTGVSMGGFMTVAMACRYPDLFAAIAPVSGTGRPEMLDALKTTPTIIFQGGADTVVPPAGAIAADKKLTELGYEHELHIFEPNGHDYKIDPYLTMSLDYFKKFRKPR